MKVLANCMNANKISYLLTFSKSALAKFRSVIFSCCAAVFFIAVIKT